jgi:hypothetical protein
VQRHPQTELKASALAAHLPDICKPRTRQVKLKAHCEAGYEAARVLLSEAGYQAARALFSKAGYQAARVLLNEAGYQAGVRS